jgi:hypothetical protein
VEHTIQSDGDADRYRRGNAAPSQPEQAQPSRPSGGLIPAVAP